MSLERIEAVLAGHREDLRTRYRVKEIGVFGSYVRREQDENSDLDILVEFEPDAGISLLDLVDLENHLSDLLGVKVDLVERSALKPRIGRHILREVVYV